MAAVTVSREATILNPLGMHARAAAKFVHPATRFDSQHPRDARRAQMDGKSIMGILLLAAARGTHRHDRGRGRRRRRRGRRAVRAGAIRLRRGQLMQRLTGHRRVARRGGRPRRDPHAAGAGARATSRAGTRRQRAAAARAARASARASSSTDIRARLAAGPGADLASLFDAQLLMLDDPMLVPPRRRRSSASSASTPSGRCSRCSTSSARCSTSVADPYLRERKGDVADLVGPPAHEPAQGTSRRRATCCASSTSRSSLDRRRADAVARRAGRLDRRSAASPPTPAAARITPRSSRDRSASRPSSACGRRPAWSTPGQLVAIDGATGELIVGPDRRRAARRCDGGEADRTAAQAAERVPAVRRGATRDGVRVRLEANLDRFEDVAAARRAGAEGIGLFRSEFLLRGHGIPGLTGPASEAAYAPS